MFADQYAEEQDAEIEELNPHQKRLTFDRDSKELLLDSDQYSSEEEGEEEPEFDEMLDEEEDDQNDVEE